jgi:hypothetical protein
VLFSQTQNNYGLFAAWAKFNLNLHPLLGVQTKLPGKRANVVYLRQDLNMIELAMTERTRKLNTPEFIFQTFLLYLFELYNNMLIYIRLIQKFS